MSVSVVFNGVTHTIPTTGETGWGSALTAFCQAVASSTLQKSGGAFDLASDADFGASFGLKAAYFKSRSAIAANSGVVRLANTEKVSFRNAGNTADLPLGVDTSNNLEFNAVDVATLATAAPAVVTFGYTSSAADTTTRYSAPGGPNAAAGTVEFAMRVPYACVIRNMYIYAQTAPAANCVYVARKDGVDTAITATMASAGTTAQDATNSVSFTAGQRLSIKHTMASATTAPANVTVSFQLTRV